jgi:hypothetical protein
MNNLPRSNPDLKKTHFGHALNLFEECDCLQCKYLRILITENIVLYLNNPLSYFPQGGKDDFAPSPVGEGWEGG